MRCLRNAAAVCLLALLTQPAWAHEHEEHDVAGASNEAAAKVQENLAGLSADDRQLAESQKYCPVMPEVLLGEMGPPIKTTLDGHAVMVCCKGCAKAAEKDPQATLKALAKIQDKVAAAAEIEANLAALSPEDREAVVAQGFCPVMTESALGSMGPPVKVDVNGQAVFVCCKGCGKKALANPDKTLKTVAELQKKTEKLQDIEASFAALAPADRGAARAQGYCVVMTDNPLGTMGAPVKIKVGDKAVYLCCAGCRRKALANPEQTLATVAELQRKVAAEASK